MRLTYLLPLLIFALLAGGLFTWGLLSDRDPGALPSALIDRPVPDFALPPLPGHAEGLASADLGGRVQVVNVFASWCAPCRVEHPLLMRLAEEDGVSVLGINYKDRPNDALAWLARDGDPYARIGADADGRVAIDWGVYGVPETYVVDAQGRIRWRHAGPLLPEQVDTELLPLIRRLEAEAAG